MGTGEAIRVLLLFCLFLVKIQVSELEKRREANISTIRKVRDALMSTVSCNHCPVVSDACSILCSLQLFTLILPFRMRVSLKEHLHLGKC